MADEKQGIESPLSSPPASVIKAGGSSPPKLVGDMDHSNDRRESTTSLPAKAAASPQTTGPDREYEPEETRTSVHASDDDGESPAPKRRARPDRASSPVKKPRRAPAAPGRPAPKKSVPRKSAQDKKWEAPFVLTDARSPLALADLRGILLLPEAWEVLTPEEKRDVLTKFPDETHILNAGTPEARPNPVSLRNDDNFRHDCARYRENLEAGRHDEEWLSQAWVAHEKHKRGEFDAFLRQQFEEEWGIKLPNDARPKESENDNGSKRNMRESSEQSQASPGAKRQKTPAPAHGSRQSTISRQSPDRDSPHQDLDLRGGSSGQSRKVAARQAPRNRVSGDKRKKRQPTRSPSLKPSNPSEAPQDQEGESIVVAQPRQESITAAADNEAENPSAAGSKRKVRQE